MARATDINVRFGFGITAMLELTAAGRPIESAMQTVVRLAVCRTDEQADKDRLAAALDTLEWACMVIEDLLRPQREDMEAVAGLRRRREEVSSGD